MLQAKPFRQLPGLCGPACLKIVTNHFGVHKSQKELAKLCECTPEVGTSAENLLSAAEELGFSGFIEDNCELEDVERYVRYKHIPVIVDWFSDGDGHYSVVVDIDDENIYLQDPQLGAVRAMRRSAFVRVWFDFPDDYAHSQEDFIIRRMIVIHPCHTYSDLIAQIKALGFPTEEIGVVRYDQEYPLYVVKAGNGPQNIFLSAGMHGDEAGAVFGLLEFLDMHVDDYLERCTFTVLVCANPSGFEDNSRKNRAGVDLNRNFDTESQEQEIAIITDYLKGKQFDLAIDLHEEDGAIDPNYTKEQIPDGFYLYETPQSKDSAIGPQMIAYLRRRGVRICATPKAYEDNNDGGIVWVKESSDAFMHSHSMDKHILQNAPHALTTEVLKTWPFQERIEVHCKAIRAALAALPRTQPKPTAR